MLRSLAALAGGRVRARVCVRMCVGARRVARSLGKAQARPGCLRRGMHREHNCERSRVQHVCSGAGVHAAHAPEWLRHRAEVYECHAPVPLRLREDLKLPRHQERLADVLVRRPEVVVRRLVYVVRNLVHEPAHGPRNRRVGSPEPQRSLPAGCGLRRIARVWSGLG